MRLTVRCSRAALCVDRLSQAALAASLQDARAAGLAFGVDAAELEQKLDEAEEADLKMAMALSMQLEEERERMAIEGRRSRCSWRRSTRARWRSRSRRVCRAAGAAATGICAPCGGGAGLLGTLPPSPGRRNGPPGERTAAQVAAAELSVRVAQEASAVREHAVKEKELRDEEAFRGGVKGGASQAEMRARTEHLKKQRDIILAQRKKARDAAAATATARPPPQPPPTQNEAASGSPAQQQEIGAHRAAGYSSGELMADAQRARLSVALASSMKASLLGEDATTLELQHRIEQHTKKIDLELTKAQLRAEVERDRGMWVPRLDCIPLL